jgi:hypothetical protein
MIILTIYSLLGAILNEKQASNYDGTKKTSLVSVSFIRLGVQAWADSDFGLHTFQFLYSGLIMGPVNPYQIIAPIIYLYLPSPRTWILSVLHIRTQANAYQFCLLQDENDFGFILPPFFSPFLAHFGTLGACRGAGGMVGHNIRPERESGRPL